MAKSIFKEKETQPATEMLHEALGDKKTLWDNIIKQHEDLYGSNSCIWKYYGKPWGWTF